MTPPYVVMSFSPEQALEVALAVKAAKDKKQESIIKPMKPPVITVELLTKAIQEAGIQDAKLVKK